jgi:hypothetical protein
MSKLRDVADGVWDPDGEATGLSLSVSDVMFEELAAASFSFPVTASDAARIPSSFRAFPEEVKLAGFTAAGDVDPFTGFGEDIADKLFPSRFVTVGDCAIGDLIGVKFLALEERNRPLYELL